MSKYQHLQRLKLARNRLTTLKGLGSLTNVVYVDASENELTGESRKRRAERCDGENHRP